VSRQVQVNSVVTDQFPVWEVDGYTKKSGETVFTATLWNDGVVSAVSVNIVEIGTSGEYRATFTPDQMGFWVLEIAIPYNEQVWSGEFDVASDHGEAQFIVGFDEDTDTLYMDIWLDRDGTSVLASELVSCSVEVFDSGGSSLFVENSASPDSDGRFRISRVQTLVTNRVYGAEVSVTDTWGTVITNQSFTTVG
jgi:hypothetical protein